MHSQKVTVYVGEPERDGWRDFSYEGSIDNCEIIERDVAPKRKVKGRRRQGRLLSQKTLSSYVFAS